MVKYLMPIHHKFTLSVINILLSNQEVQFDHVCITYLTQTVFMFRVYDVSHMVPDESIYYFVA